MTCGEVEARLDEYVDGALGARDRAALEAHLAECVACRAALAELRGLVANARALPQRIEPRRELWTGIAARITERRQPARGTGRAWWRERAFWAGVSAAAATLVLALGVYRLTGPAWPSRPVQGWGMVEADYERATAELSRTLAAERHRLRPETVGVVERNLQLIDAALGEARAALAQDPGNADLRQLVATAARQKVELLQWAARVATAS
jgi:anti-sigma-K factor RskA